ncbi:MAG TPA: VOC family protein [Vicinamibacterales bacterium]|nr:VOC family protein [Vicinamibacterales bacterium]
MSSTARPVITCEHYHAILQVRDLPASIDFYTSKLGFSFDFDDGESPRFAAVSFGDNAQLFLERGTPSPAGCGLYFVVNDADAMCDRCQSAGVTIAAVPADRPYGLRDFSIQDLDGYYVTFGHRLECDPEP